MSDNRKYYYLKLKENYFDDDSIVLLESMQDGVLYSNILLKLYLKSLKHGGRLQLDEDIPYTAQMIATITRQQIGTVERALQIFLKLGLVEVLDSGTFYMSNIELLIGQSSTESERKRAARLQNKALSALRTSGGHLSDIRPPEIEKVRPETGHPSHTYGRYQNVFLTDEELADLQVSFPAVWEQYIEKLSEYIVYFGYLMEYSCLKTLANKHRSRIAKVRYEYRDGTGAWGVPYETKKGKRRMMFAKYSDCKGKDLTEKVPDLAYRYSHNTTSFEERLKAKVCEVCGCTDSDSYEIHHVNKVKNLKGKADWEKVMLAKRRKTIVVCHKCHMRIHHGTKTE